VSVGHGHGRGRRGLGLLSGGGGRASLDDPLDGVANLFDTGIVFALGFLVALVSALHLLDMFDPGATTTVTTERADGLEVVVRRGGKTVVRRLSRESGSGDGTRVGAAFRLADGTVVYVPEEGEAAPGDRP